MAERHSGGDNRRRLARKVTLAAIFALIALLGTYVIVGVLG